MIRILLRFSYDSEETEQFVQAVKDAVHAHPAMKGASFSVAALDEFGDHVFGDEEE